MPEGYKVTLNDMKKRKKVIKRIKKKSVTSYAHLPDTGKRHTISTSVHYEVSTIKYNDQGVKILETHERLDELPKAMRDMTTSRKILEQIKKHGPMNKVTDNRSGDKVVSNMNSRLLNLNDGGTKRNSQDMT